MSVFNEQLAYLKAIELITAGLQSNAIKLAGVGNSTTNSTHIKLDSEYINGMLNEIAKNLTVD